MIKRIFIIDLSIYNLDYFVVECAALVITDDANNRSLAIFLVLNLGVTAPVLSDIWDAINELLPRYMIPNQYAVLPALPLTSNGKRDIQKLKNLALKPVIFDDYVAPRTDVEIELCLLWQQVLDQQKIGINNNFFELGGHSLLAMQLIAAINQRFTTELTITYGSPDS